MAAATSRRAVLGTVAAIATAAAIPAGAQAQVATGISAELAALIARADREDALSAAFERDVFDPARERWVRQCDGVPHIQVPAPYNSLDGSAERVWSTDDLFAVRRALSTTRGRASFHGPGSDDARCHHRCLRRLAVAHRWRERKLARIRRDTGFDAAYDKSARLSEVVYAADMAVVRYPAVTMPDLLAVLAFMERRGLADDQQCIDMLSAGIRRVAGEA